MPRPVPPAILQDPEAPLYALDRYARRDIAKTLLPRQFSEEQWAQLEEGIGAAKASLTLNETCTVANVVCVLRDLDRTPAKRRRALRILADPAAAIDHDTAQAVSRHASAVLGGEPGAAERLELSAWQRIRELERKERAYPSTEALALFCSYLQLIWGEATGRWLFHGAPRRNVLACRRFALAVLGAADIGPASLFDNPGRLDEYLKMPWPEMEPIQHYFGTFVDRNFAAARGIPGSP